MLKRIATAVVLIPIVMLLVLRAPVPVVAVVAAAVALITVHEFLKLTESYGVQPLRLPTYIFVGLFFLLLAASAIGETPQVSGLKFVLELGFACCDRSLSLSDDRMRRAQLTQRISGGGGLGIRLCLHCPAHGNAGAASPAVGGSVLAALSCFWWFGRETFSLTSWAAPWDGI